jgi:hypothetical protein
MRRYSAKKCLKTAVSVATPSAPGVSRIVLPLSITAGAMAASAAGF